MKRLALSYFFRYRSNFIVFIVIIFVFKFVLFIKSILVK